MAERRMFSRSVVTSDAFLDLSLGAQALYLQLAMQADDDGIIANPRRIERMLGTGGGAREELLGCGFLLPLDGGLVAITHWRVQNLLRRDRYKPTRYSREAAALTVAESGEYVLSDVAAAAWQPKGDRAAPEDRVGESSGIEDSGGESSDRPTAPCISDRADAPAAHAAPITPNTATASSPDRTSGAVHPPPRTLCRSRRSRQPHRPPITHRAPHTPLPRTLCRSRQTRQPHRLPTAHRASHTTPPRRSRRSRRSRQPHRPSTAHRAPYTPPPRTYRKSAATAPPARSDSQQRSTPRSVSSSVMSFATARSRFLTPTSRRRATDRSRTRRRSGGG